MSPPIREGMPRTVQEAMEDLRAAVIDLEELADLPDVPVDAVRLAAQAALRMTGAAMVLVMPSVDQRVNVEPGVEAHALRWYSFFGGTIGFVGLVDRACADPFFKVYIGIGNGDDTDRDIARIARSGHPLLDEVMARHLVGEHWAFAGLRYEF